MAVIHHWGKITWAPSQPVHHEVCLFYGGNRSLCGSEWIPLILLVVFCGLHCLILSWILERDLLQVSEVLSVCCRSIPVFCPSNFCHLGLSGLSHLSRFKESGRFLQGSVSLCWSPKTLSSQGDHRVHFVSCLSGILVFPCLMYNVRKTLLLSTLSNCQARGLFWYLLFHCSWKQTSL